MGAAALEKRKQALLEAAVAAFGRSDHEVWSEAKEGDEEREGERQFDAEKQSRAAPDERGGREGGPSEDNGEEQGEQQCGAGDDGRAADPGEEAETAAHPIEIGRQAGAGVHIGDYFDRLERRRPRAPSFTGPKFYEVQPRTRNGPPLRQRYRA